MVELLGHPGALGVGLGGGQVFLGVLDAAIERGGIEFGERNGFLGQHGDRARVHFDEAAARDEIFGPRDFRVTQRNGT